MGGCLPINIVLFFMREIKFTHKEFSSDMRVVLKKINYMNYISKLPWLALITLWFTTPKCHSYAP